MSEPLSERHLRGIWNLCHLGSFSGSSTEEREVLEARDFLLKFFDVERRMGFGPDHFPGRIGHHTWERR